MTTNEFGTAAGEFTIPRAARSGPGSVPSVISERGARFASRSTSGPPSRPRSRTRKSRCDSTVRRADRARRAYYFGLPVDDGQGALARHARRRSIPWWCWWYGWGGAGAAETIAAGRVDARADGTFTLAFTPDADERLRRAKAKVDVPLQVEADVTDEGGRRGRPRAVPARLRLRGGARRLRARIPPRGSAAERHGRAHGPRRGRRAPGRDLAPRARSTSRTAARCRREPADLPPDAGANRYRDARRRCVRAGHDRLFPERVDGAAGRRRRGPRTARVTHDANGEANRGCRASRPGAYRLRYETRDECGAVFEMPTDFVVAGARTPLALPAVLLAERGTVPVGGTARLLAPPGSRAAHDTRDRPRRPQPSSGAT